MKWVYSTLVLAMLLSSCNRMEEDTSELFPSENELYFPPITGTEWASVDLDSSNWNESALPELFDHLSTNGTRAFIMLKDGKMAVEKYWGDNILNTGAFNQNSSWYWASAAKSLTATLVGIAQQEGHLDIDDKTSDYLGKNWTSLSPEKEDLITIRHQLTMTTGLDYKVSDLYCTEPNCLEYKNDAGKQWYYHNAPYTLLENVVSIATGIDYNLYTDQKVEAVTGMNGQWIKLGYNNLYWSTARDMARFGLMILNKGKWNETLVLSDENYYNQMINKSQDLNNSYGYLWWLNGQGSIIFPGLPTRFNIDLSDSAPSDLFAAIGKDGQFIDIVPSQNLVVIRIGKAPEGSLVPVNFHNEMWEKINLVLNN